MNLKIEFARKMSLAYTAVCRPLCQEMKLPQTAFDILMFFGNNPEYRTARDVVEIRNIKANLVSVNVERLVREGYLERHSVAGDRRKMELLCTEKAKPVILEGRAVQQDFREKLLDGMEEETQRIFRRALKDMEHNIEEILKGAQ